VQSWTANFTPTPMIGAFAFVVAETITYHLHYCVGWYEVHRGIYVKFLCQWLLDNCLEDMEFMADKIDEGCIDRLKMVKKDLDSYVLSENAIYLLRYWAGVQMSYICYT